MTEKRRNKGGDRRLVDVEKWVSEDVYNRLASTRQVLELFKNSAQDRRLATGIRQNEHWSHLLLVFLLKLLNGRETFNIDLLLSKISIRTGENNKMAYRAQNRQFIYQGAAC